MNADFAHPESDLSGYRLVGSVPALYLVSDAGADNVRRFAADGGTVADQLLLRDCGPASTGFGLGGYPAPLASICSGCGVEEFAPLPEGAVIRLDRADEAGGAVEAGGADPGEPAVGPLVAGRHRPSRSGPAAVATAQGHLTGRGGRDQHSVRPRRDVLLGHAAGPGGPGGAVIEKCVPSRSCLEYRTDLPPPASRRSGAVNHLFLRSATWTARGT